MARMINCDGSWVEVDLRVVRDNVAAIRAALGPTQLMAVIKSDAYGHGLTQLAAALAGCGVRHFAVAYVAEAEAVRAVAPNAEMIVVLGATWPADVPRLLRSRITPAVVSQAHGEALAAAAVAAGGELPVHLKLDTGMGRLGFICPDELPTAAALTQLPGLSVQGVCTHFAMVEPERKPTAARNQVEKFKQAVPMLEAS